ncbi:tryptophan--tRNA ligase [bacterium]|nr:tryptophan--tRNA ligase [bacterium]
MAGRRRIVSGCRPTGRLHLGHLRGALVNWLRLQDEGECFFFVADWHALTTGWQDPSGVRDSTREMVLDWLAAGLDPERVVLFVQSAVKEHAELHLLLSMIVPTPWLLRNPTIKEQARELGLLDSGDDETAMSHLNYGMLGYPVLQSADILIYRATGVPVGVDQVPHLEMTREVARRFNHLYGKVLVEPEALLTESPKIPGTDGRKMSKSYHNAVFLSEPPDDIARKLERMATDPRRVRRTDPGDPNDCPAYNLHRIYCTPQELAVVNEGCRSAGIGCLDCKRLMIKHVLAEIAPICARRGELERTPEIVGDVLASGNARARRAAAETMGAVREAMKI